MARSGGAVVAVLLFGCAADHHLNDEARADRDAWLAETLGFPAPE